jgi:hypothetical protein
MAKVSNKDCRKHVQNREPFDGSNLWGVWQNSTIVEDDSKFYVVYSYGHHWPLFVYAEGVWFENEESFSQSTKRHRSQANPHVNTVLLSCYWMKKLAVLGFRGIADQRILTGEAA